MADAKPTNETAFLQDMREAYRDSVDADRLNREEAAGDLKFLAGEQWEPEVLDLRAGRPTLKLNRMPQFVRQVTGDIRINKPSIKVTAISDPEDQQAMAAHQAAAQVQGQKPNRKAKAEVIEGLIRHIEHVSDAGRVYAGVADAQVGCGMGHMRLTVEYPDDSFDAELQIGAIRNPFAVIWDGASDKPDRSDARHCFVESSLPRKVFEKRFPDADMTSWVGTAPRGLTDWIGKDKVRVAEYWQVQQRPVTLFLLANGAVIDDDAEDSIRKAAEQVGIVRERKTTRPKIVQYLTNGKELLSEPYVWPGRRIPIFTAWGEEIVLGERIYRHGLIRFARDPQYLINYFMSAAVETLGLQPKPKWLANADAVKGREQDWANANTSADATLIYNGANAPTFVPPPPFPAAFIQMGQLAEDAMKATTGIYDAALGARSNETSGVAIKARDHQGDVSTFIYPDNLTACIQSLAKEIIVMVPHTYDAERQIRSLGEDMKAEVIQVNSAGGIDLTTGRYDVSVSTGPGFTSRREQAAQGMLDLIAVYPAAAPALGDLLARLQDWPEHDEVADRLSRIMPPGLNGQAPAPPPVNPKDMATMELTNAETHGVQLENMRKALELGFNSAMAGSFVSTSDLTPGGGAPPEPSGAPGETPGQSVPQGM